VCNRHGGGREITNRGFSIPNRIIKVRKKKQITRFVHPHTRAHVFNIRLGPLQQRKTTERLPRDNTNVFNTLFKHGCQCPPHCTFYRVDNYPSAATALLLYSGCATLSHLRTMRWRKQLAPLFYRYMPTTIIIGGWRAQREWETVLYKYMVYS